MCQNINKYGAENISLGKTNLNGDFFKLTNDIGKQFYAISQKYGIEIPTLRQFKSEYFIEYWKDYFSHGK